ncbi:hypothetical protein WMZ97_19915 [Lentibacillus sp. N15]
MKQDYHHVYETCKQHMHSYVLAEMVDGSKVDGIVTGLDEEYVYLAVPLAQHEQDMHQMHEHQQNRQVGFGYGQPGGFGYPGGGFGYPGGYGYPGGGYGYPGGPRRRFRRLILPLAGLTALSLLPWY